jgi:hypothetical protein
VTTADLARIRAELADICGALVPVTELVYDLYHHEAADKMRAREAMAGVELLLERTKRTLDEIEVTTRRLESYDPGEL